MDRVGSEPTEFGLAKYATQWVGDQVENQNQFPSTDSLAIALTCNPVRGRAKRTWDK